MSTSGRPAQVEPFESAPADERAGPAASRPRNRVPRSARHSGGRLRDLQQAQILERREVPPPTPAAVYQLTERGEALRPVIRCSASHVKTHTHASGLSL
jgi:hypothetical protein